MNNETLDIHDLGRLGYEPALKAQRQTHAAVCAGDAPDTLLLVEHDPVFTLGRRAKAEHLLAGADQLQQQGIAVYETDRGGDITYHGPGQLVAYPIVDLNRLGLNLRKYVWALEQAIIDTLAHFGVAAGRDAEAVGVWVGGDLQHDAASRDQAGRGDAKIAAIGVRAERWVTLHGLALNVTTNLDHYKLIVPCGIADRPVTSMHEQLGDGCPTMGAVKSELAQQLAASIRATGD